jgi:hypothetical protein
MKSGTNRLATAKRTTATRPQRKTKGKKANGRFVQAKYLSAKRLRSKSQKLSLMTKSRRSATITPTKPNKTVQRGSLQAKNKVKRKPLNSKTSNPMVTSKKKRSGRIGTNPAKQANPKSNEAMSDLENEAEIGENSNHMDNGENLNVDQIERTIVNENSSEPVNLLKAEVRRLADFLR